MKIFIVLLLFVSSVVDADIYKWTDSEGNVHFGDRPAAGVTAKEITVNDNASTGFTSSSGNQEQREYLLKKIDRDKKAEADKQRKLAAENENRRKLCDDYRRKYQVHIQSSRSYTMSPDGVRSWLSADERTARKKKLERGIRQYCR